MDLDFGRGEITVRQGKGQKDGVTMPPGDLVTADNNRRIPYATEIRRDLR
jgi:hypothetical protein